MPILFLLLLLASSGFALTIDDKLSSQIISVSKTRKTVVTKRGIEDGIRLGDHAKLFDKEGMFAWGMAIKLSPNRTIWHLYQIISLKKLIPGRIMGLKMSAPAMGQEKLRLQLEALDKPRDRNQSVKLLPFPKKGKPPFPFDLHGSIGMSSHSFTRDDEVVQAYNQDGHKARGNRFTIGASYPFYRFSVGALLGYSIDQSERSAGFKTQTNTYELIFTMEYNFSSPPYYEKFFPFVHIGYGLGNTRIERDAATTTNQFLLNDFADQAGRSKISYFGVGLKKVYASHLGLKATLDYLTRKEFYKLRSLGEYTRREKSGPVMSLGLFYQFR